MTVQRLRRSLIVTLVVGGAAAVASPRVPAQEMLPTEGGMITLVGCFMPGGKHHSKFVLAKPVVGSVESVPDGTCAPSVDETAVELKDTAARHLGVGMLNHVIEVTGRLEKLEGHTDLKDLREVHVRSFRPVPVVVPAVAAAPSAPAPYLSQPQAAIPPLPTEDRPVATSGTVPAELPKTASSLPLFALISLLSLSAALSLNLVGRRRRE